MTSRLVAPFNTATYVTIMNAPKKSRLGPQDWLNAGLDALAKDGADALKAEPLARRLGTTKGSFYWHFDDVPAFHAALLSRWETQALSDLEKTLEHEYTPTGRLRHIAQAIAEKDREPGAETAIRAWAKGNTKAAKSIARVDGKRMALLHDLLADTGIRNPEMARIIYAAGIGMEELGEASKDENVRSMGSLVDLVLALR